MAESLVVFDTNILLLILQPSAKPPIDQNTRNPLLHAQERIEYLVKRLSKAQTKIIVPAPVLTELLFYSGTATEKYLERLQTHPFVIAPFGKLAAIECSIMLKKHGLKDADKKDSRAKVKFDRQIIAIAKVEKADTVYSDDNMVVKYSTEAGIKAVTSFDLELDPDSRQENLQLGGDSSANEPPAI
jgi:predicted nucleic acid-binding protein